MSNERSHIGRDPISRSRQFSPILDNFHPLAFQEQWKRFSLLSARKAGMIHQHGELYTGHTHTARHRQLSCATCSISIRLLRPATRIAFSSLFPSSFLSVQLSAPSALLLLLAALSGTFARGSRVPCHTSIVFHAFRTARLATESVHKAKRV